MDAIYTAMKRLGYGDGVEIAVGEAGWPGRSGWGWRRPGISMPG